MWKDKTAEKRVNRAFFFEFEAQDEVWQGIC